MDHISRKIINFLSEERIYMRNFTLDVINHAEQSSKTSQPLQERNVEVESLNLGHAINTRIDPIACKAIDLRIGTSYIS